MHQRNVTCFTVSRFQLRVLLLTYPDGCGGQGDGFAGNVNYLLSHNDEFNVTCISNLLCKLIHEPTTIGKGHNAVSISKAFYVDY